MVSLNFRFDESPADRNPASVTMSAYIERDATFEKHRKLMFSIAYRMLHKRVDAEDVLQDTFLRWQRSSNVGIKDPRAFLARIVTRLCLNHLHSARTRKKYYVSEGLSEESMLASEADVAEIVSIDESLSRATLLLLERLKPIERAVFVMREIFDYEYREISATLRQSEGNCRQLLHRAREHLGSLRRRSIPSKLDHALFLRRFIAATRGGEVDSLVEFLAADAKR